MSPPTAKAGVQISGHIATSPSACAYPGPGSMRDAPGQAASETLAILAGNSSEIHLRRSLPRTRATVKAGKRVCV